MSRETDEIIFRVDPVDAPVSRPSQGHNSFGAVASMIPGPSGDPTGTGPSGVRADDHLLEFSRGAHEALIWVVLGGMFAAGVVIGQAAVFSS